MCAAPTQVTANDQVIDGLKFVAERQTLAGAVPVAVLPRLAEGLHSNSGSLDYQIRGDSDPQDRPLLRLRVRGRVQLQCQRCLEGFEHEVDIDTALRLVAADALDAEHDDNPDAADCIAANAALDVSALIEDEVLLDLPPYPRHETDRCAARLGDSAHSDAAGVADVAQAKIMAFSALQALKQKVYPSKE